MLSFTPVSARCRQYALSLGQAAITGKGRVLCSRMGRSRAPRQTRGPALRALKYRKWREKRPLISESCAGWGWGHETGKERAQERFSRWAATGKVAARTRLHSAGFEQLAPFASLGSRSSSAAAAGMRKAGLFGEGRKAPSRSSLAVPQKSSHNKPSRAQAPPPHAHRFGATGPQALLPPPSRSHFLLRWSTTRRLCAFWNNQLPTRTPTRKGGQPASRAEVLSLFPAPCQREPRRRGAKERRWWRSRGVPSSSGCSCRRVPPRLRLFWPRVWIESLSRAPPPAPH